ncbi:unnamed protein product [Candidula unifasciata]|uniref:Uncharacterized protein n=1 Tax=Candidula unifasciata TaxID=100452 RepID=A0A8S3YZ04_9EUPU|nr:unnamed protein product [Candidula unifasciata]
MPSIEGVLSVQLRGTMGRQLTWRPIKEGGMSGGDRISSFIIDETDVGEVSQVLVRFQNQGNSLSRRVRSLLVKSVEVDFVMKFPKKHFCPTNGVVQDGREIVLTSGSYFTSACP